MSQARYGLSPEAWRMAIAAGVLVGVAYALSPLTVWFMLAIALIVRWACNRLDGSERRWILALLIVAIGLRVVAVGVLFVSTDHAQAPFGVFFGDEEYDIRRSIWMRNLWLGLPLHTADLIYLFDETGLTSHLNVLALLQVLVGPAPYGVHLLGIAFYIAASVLLYRAVRASLGRMPAMIGLLLLLYLPSLFAWSISALKEPLFFLMTASSIVLTIAAVRRRGWMRLVPAAAVVGLVVGLSTLRQGGAVLSAAGLLGGLAIAFLTGRPRLLLTAVVLVPVVTGAALSRPEAQIKVYGAVQAAARQHWGHVATAGYVYRVLDPRFYPDRPDFAGRAEIDGIGFGEGVRFIWRSLERYVTVPLPWEVQSRAALLYLPEQIIWYLLVVLAVPGAVLAMRRDALLTSVLLAHAVVAALTVALTSGNVGTLVRHRGLALPYFLWLSAVAFCELVTRIRAAAPETPWPLPPAYPHEKGMSWR